MDSHVRTETTGRDGTTVSLFFRVGNVNLNGLKTIQGHIERMTLTPRENDVLRLLLTTKSGSECANELGVTHATFRTYCHWVFMKEGVSGRMELLAMELKKAREQ